MIKELGTAKTDQIFFEAGKKAGQEFCANLIDKNNDFDGFIQQLQNLLSSLKIGILRIEKADFANMDFTITVAEDLDCSGLPVSEEMVCTYDEGFLSGILSSYSGSTFNVKEVDCWCSGDRVCRFEAKVQ
jgi:uncharacterized protein